MARRTLKRVVFPAIARGEHLNVSMYMNALQSLDKDDLFGFNHEVPGSIPHGQIFAGGNKYVEALSYTGDNCKAEKLGIILEGLDLFEKLFGYWSKSFIPPNYL